MDGVNRDEEERLPLLEPPPASTSTLASALGSVKCAQACTKCARRRNVDALADNLYRMCHMPSVLTPVSRNSAAVAEYAGRGLPKAGAVADGMGAGAGASAGGVARAAGAAVTDDVKRLKAAGGRLSPEVRGIVRTVYALAFCTMAIMTSISPTVLLYMRHARLISVDSVQFYVTCNVIASSAPVVFNAGLGFLASLVGPARALAVSSLAVALGLLGMAAFSGSKLLFGVSFGLYSMLQSLRTIRTLIIAEYVPQEFRTEVMSIHALMTPLGALIGPLVWLLIERYPAEHVLIGSLRANKYSLDYGVATCILLIIASIAIVRLGGLPGQQHAHNHSSDSSGEISELEPLNGSENGSTVLTAQHESIDHIHVRLTDGREFDVNPDRYRRRIFIYFSVIMACVNISMGLYSVSWQPIMVNVFEADGQKLGIIFEIISVFAVIPPLLVAYLSRHLQDRHILLIGIIAKMVGIMCFLPIFGRVREWQVVAGFIIIIKASIFFFTASMSLFTKLLGGMTSGILLGVLSSASALGPAVAQIFFTDIMLARFGSFSFGVFGLPVLVALGLVLWPWFWTRLDASREFIRKLLEEYDHRHPKPSAHH
jgi:MFS family permease